MDSIRTFGPMVSVGGFARILKNEEGNAVFDLNNNGQVDTADSAVLTRNSIEGCTGQVPTPFDKLKGYVTSVGGTASSSMLAEMMTANEWAGSGGRVVDVVSHQELKSPGREHFSTVFHFRPDQEPYAEFIFRDSDR